MGFYSYTLYTNFNNISFDTTEIDVDACLFPCKNNLKACNVLPKSLYNCFCLYSE